MSPIFVLGSSTVYTVCDSQHDMFKSGFINCIQCMYYYFVIRYLSFNFKNDGMFYVYRIFHRIKTNFTLNTFNFRGLRKMVV